MSVTPESLKAEAQALLTQAETLEKDAVVAAPVVAKAASPVVADVKAVAVDVDNIVKAGWQFVSSQIWKLAGSAGVVVGSAGVTSDPKTLTISGAAVVVAHALAELFSKKA